MISRIHHDDATLDRLLHDSLREDEQNVAEHVETCELCQEKIDTLSCQDLSWDEVGDLLQEPLVEFGSIHLHASGHGNDEEGDGDSEQLLANHLTFLDPSDQPNSIGRFARYEIQQVLGRGGMGIVMQAFDTSLGRQCAVKVLAPELATSAAARKRFSREARSAAAVVHPHVVPIQTVDEHNGLPYLVMPVVEGQSLQHRVQTNGPLSIIETVRIATQVAEGLAAAHGQGLVHRDIKPANILLANGVERVQITDFRLARAIDDASMTRSGVIAGTPQYMSPEQAHGDSIDHRSDIFSLGSVIYFMLTGRSPFRAETTMGVLNRIGNDEPRSLQSINSEVPEWLGRVVGRLLAKSPDDRCQTASEVAQSLQNWHAHLQQPDAVQRPAVEPALSVGGNGSRMRRWIIGTALLAGCAFIAGVIVLDTGKGTIRIENNSELAVPIVIRQGDRIVDTLTISQAGASTRLKAGRYVIEVDGTDTTFTMQGDQVILSRGEIWVARIEQAGAATEANESHENVDPNKPGKRASDPGYLIWKSPEQVCITDWFAKTIRLKEPQLKAVNELLTNTWKKYIEAESDHSEYSRTAEGHLKVVVNDFVETRTRLDTEFWEQLIAMVDGRTEDVLHAISTQRGDGHGDDTWPSPTGRNKSYPSILGWNHAQHPVTVELWKRGRYFHYRVSNGKSLVAGDAKSLPAEFEHYWRLGSLEFETAAVGPTTIAVAPKAVDLGGKANASGVIEGGLKGFPDDERNVKYSITLAPVKPKPEGKQQVRNRELGPRKPGVVISSGERYQFTGVPAGQWTVHAVAMIQSRRQIIGKPVQLELAVRPHQTTQIGISFNSEDNTAGWVESISINQKLDNPLPNVGEPEAVDEPVKNHE